jgi:hypothetical protein
MIIYPWKRLTCMVWWCPGGDVLGGVCTGELCGQISLAAPEWTNEEIGLYGRMYWLPGNRSMTSWSAPSSLQAQMIIEENSVTTLSLLFLHEQEHNGTLCAPLALHVRHNTGLWFILQKLTTLSYIIVMQLWKLTRVILKVSDIHVNTEHLIIWLVRTYNTCSVLS